MHTPDLPAALQAFLFDCIESYEQLELLILLQREPRWWTAAGGAVELRVPESMAAQALEDLTRNRLLEARGETLQREFRYFPASSELDYKARLLARHYSDQRFEIVKLMSSNSIERLRTAALRTFADAFLIKRETERAPPDKAAESRGPGKREDGDDP